MNGRRALADLLIELADGVADLAGLAGNAPVRTRSLSLSLPIDLRLASTDEGLQVIGDVPLFLTRTDFDPDPARLEIDWHTTVLATEQGS